MKKSRIILAVLIFLAGLGLIAYPYVSDYFHKQAQHEVIAAQEKTVASVAKEDLSADLKAAQDYNERLLTSKNVVTDPFDPNTQRVTSQEYESLLNLSGDGVMGTLVIPRIDLNMPIYHYTNDDELQHGVGHMEATSLPVGGPSTHAVLAGHNGLPSVKIFDRLDELELGDYFVIQVLGEDHAYRVTSKETVLPEETESLVVQADKDLVTLVTCTPYGINTHRLLVHAERCDLPAEWGEKDQQKTAVASTEPEVPLVQFTLVGIAVALGLVVSWWLATHRRKGPATGPAAPAPRGAHFAAPSASGLGTNRHRASDGYVLDETAPLSHGAVRMKSALPSRTRHHDAHKRGGRRG